MMHSPIMSSSSRAPAPAPLSLGGPATKVASNPTVSTTPKSADTMHRSLSGESHFGSYFHSHNSRSPTRKQPSPFVNAHSYCGRHTNQYLFGGRKMTDIFRAIVHRD